MTTFATMISRIEREIHRTNKNAEVRSAILSAIEHFEEGRQFHFNTERSIASTVIGQKFLPLPDDFVDFIGKFPLQITVNQSTYPLNRRRWDYLQFIDLDAVVGRGIPFDWTYGDNQLRLYPIPQDIYILCLYYKKKLAAITADDTSNAWMVDGERVVRARAKWDIYTNVIHQFDKAQQQKIQEAEAFQSLLGIRQRRATSGDLQGYYM